MKKVLHLIYHAHFGGIEKVVYDILKYQAGHSNVAHDLLILNPKGEYLSKFESLPISLHKGDFTSGLDFSKAKISAIKDLFKEYDLVHFHVFHLPAIRSATSARVKTVYTEHGNFGFGRKVRLSDRVNHWFKGRFLRKRVHFITYNSEFTRDYAQKKYGLKHGRERVVYNGVDFDQLRKQEASDFSAGEGHFKVGTISRLAGFKRIDRLIAAFARFVAEKQDVKLYIGGDGQLRKALEAQAAELNVQDQVVFTGYLQNATDFMRQMDLCVFPSQSEPFGIVAIESLSKQRPTLVFADGGGLVDIIQRFNKEDVVADETALVQRLDFYYTQKDQENHPGTENQQILERVFSIGKMCASFDEVYSSL